MNAKLETITKRKNQKTAPSIRHLIYNPLRSIHRIEVSLRLKTRRKNEFSPSPSLLNRRRNINPGITSAAIRLILRPQSSQKIFKSGAAENPCFPFRSPSNPRGGHHHHHHHYYQARVKDAPAFKGSALSFPMSPLLTRITRRGTS